MTLDLTQFHDIFFEESFEALDSMEAALLKLSAGEVDAELINTIFRVAHSIKGGAATFGFTEVAGFTHTLETLLDQLRAGKRQVRPDIVDVLLRSGDLMREMLVATQHKQAIDSASVATLRAETRSHHGRGGQQPAAMPAPRLVPPRLDGARPSRQTCAHSGWRIKFVPGPKLLRHGNDPLRILRELATLGDLKVSVDAVGVPALARARPRSLPAALEPRGQGDIDRAAVNAVFEWAEGECELDHRAYRRRAPRGASATPAPVPAACATAAPPRGGASRAGRRQPRRAAPAPMAARSASASRRSTS